MTQVPLEQVVDHVKKLLRRGDTARAVPIVGDIVRQAGPAPLSRMMQGIMAIQFGQYDHAIQVLEQVSFELIGDDQRDATVALARARTLSGDPEGALITIEPVCEADDAPGSAHRAKAEALVAAGRADEARAHLQSLPGDVAEPHEIALAWAAVALEADRGDPVHEAAIEHLSTERERVGVPAGALADICLAYAELHARAGDDAAAATLFKRSISMNPTKADPRPYAQTVMKLINGWSGPALGRAQKLESNTDDRPVFVVGMPGGGPELVAALLGTHDGVRVVDHAEALTAMVGRHVVGKAGAEPVVLDPSKPGAKQLRDAAAGYLQRLGVDAEPGGDSPDRVVDPYPLNLHVLGLVAQMFPRARVIVVRRDPFDACFGCMLRHRDARMLYANEPRATTVFAGGLRRLEEHWLGIFAGDDLPLRHLAVDYATLAAGGDAVADLFNFVGVDAPDTARTDAVLARHLRSTGHQVGLEPRFGKRLPELADAVAVGDIGPV